MEDSRKKTYIADIERGVYDIKDEMHHKFTTGKGLTEEIVRKIPHRRDTMVHTSKHTKAQP